MNGGNMNEDKSFIVINRKILKWHWYDDVNVTRLFIHLLLIANWEDKKWHGILVKRGQVITGRKTLSEETGLSEQQVRTSLDKLISTKEITKSTTNKYTIITVNNYNKYQNYNQQITNKQPTNNQQITNNQPANNQQILDNSLCNNQQITNKQPKNNQKITTTKQYNNITNNISSSSIYSFVEENLGRTLSPIEYEKIAEWKDTELTRYAIKKAILNGKYSIGYINGILNNYKKNNITTIKQAQAEEENFKSKRDKTKITKKVSNKGSSWELLEKWKKECENEENEKDRSD